MRYHLITVILLCIHVSVAIGQNQHLADSFIQVYENQPLELKEKFQVSKKIAHHHPNFSVALEYANTALELANQLEEPLYKAQAYEEISLNQYLLGNRKKSVEYTFEALKIFEELEKTESMASSYAQLAANFLGDNEFKEAINYYKKSIEILKNSDNQLNYTLSILNLGEAFRMAKNYDSAIVYFNKALLLNHAINNSIVKSYSIGNLGMTYAAINKVSMAKSHLTEAIDLCTILGDPYSTSVYMASLADVYEKEGNPQKAEDQLLKALSLAVENGLKEQIRDVNSALADFYEQQGNNKAALVHLKEFHAYEDSLVNKDKIRQIERIRANYEIDKRESEINLLSTINSKQKSLVTTLAISVSVFCIFSILLYRAYQQKKKNNLLLAAQKDEIAQREEEKALLLRELNHRIKNNLQMIASLLNLQGNALAGHPAAAAIDAGRFRVEALSLIHQKLYREDVHTTIDIKDYLKELTLNLCYSYGSELRPQFNITNVSIDIDTAIPLALIVNELVTNALKYAFEGIKNPQLCISLRQTDQLILEITDNGKGIDINIEETPSFGIKLVRSLVNQLNGSFELKKATPQGTHWIISL
ncbi:ATP-binding protein [Fulvivirga maritima]|uniref:histidine kinase dimerization/phosphoacceptor domain -containing protein n=1 Tax=Fulvivirga maritima TaxID=2904247 RepID=UPI001F37C91C|nr:histidine kinase dimerization/phosphoacceptor domain -containing protein [Fulvivirga maritima]UII26533.1 ATP-binding protein [Fulvivirga maritima]